MLRIIFFLTFFCICETLILQCMNCSETLDPRSSESINTILSSCPREPAQHLSCSQLLRERYTGRDEEKQMSAKFEPSPEKYLPLSNAAQIMTNTTTIWLNQVEIERKFELLCYNNDACTTDAIKNIYDGGEL